MGAIFHVPVRRVRSVDELPAPRVALVAREGRDARRAARAGDAASSAPSARACPADVLAACDEVAHIPIAERSP